MSCLVYAGRLTLSADRQLERGGNEDDDERKKHLVQRGTKRHPRLARMLLHVASEVTAQRDLSLLLVKKLAKEFALFVWWRYTETRKLLNLLLAFRRTTAVCSTRTPLAKQSSYPVLLPRQLLATSMRMCLLYVMQCARLRSPNISRNCEL